MGTERKRPTGRTLLREGQRTKDREGAGEEGPKEALPLGHQETRGTLSSSVVGGF